ncbi:MAG: sulfite exporter TauE/SafE family protein [Pelistega sp.]|nr:sulfite exporter TauE/SafE family protein [Pelistega sp.]
MESIYLITALGAIVAGFAQGLSGFAFGLVAMSFWAWALDPQLAAVLSVIGGLTGQIVAAFTVRRGFNWAMLAPFIAGGLCGIPIGVWLLPMLDIYKFKAILGTFLILWCPAMLLAKNFPKITLQSRLADGIVGLAGGVMGGIGGFTGTLPTLWCTLRGLDRDTQRSIIQNFNFALLIVITITYASTGIIQADMWPYFLIVSPIVVVTAFIGTRLYLGISPERFRQIVLGFLIVSGISMLSSALPHLNLF